MLVIQDWGTVWMKTYKGKKQNLQELKQSEWGWDSEGDWGSEGGQVGGGGNRRGGVKGGWGEKQKQFSEACKSL